MAKKNITVGLDVGTHSAKCAVMDPGSGKIQGLWETEIFPDRTSEDDKIESDRYKERLDKLIAGCEKTYPDFNRRVRTSVPGEFFRYLELPAMSAKELETAVPFEAQKHIPFPMDEITLNYISVPKLGTGPQRDQSPGAVFFVAAKKESVRAITHLLEACGLSIERIEVPTLAIAREFARNHSKSFNELSALLHIGFAESRLIVAQNGYPYYTRKIPVAGRDFTYAFQMSRQSSWKEAEKYKLSYDISRHEIGLEPFLNRFIEEIKKSLDFFAKESKHAAGKPSKIFLSGGTALMAGLADYLSEQLGMAVAADSWDDLDGSATKIDSAPYKIAVGLALD